MSRATTKKKPHSDLGRRFGAYEVKAVLGEGGMGVVYRVEHQRLGRQVALKRLRDRLASNRRAIKRFVDEAWAIGQIQHANIVKISDFVLGENDVYYIMELLEGRTLADELETVGALPPQRAVHITLEIAAALAAVHAKGFVHADIKPSNIFLVDTNDGDKAVKLLDFGVASLMHDEAKVADDGTTRLVTPVYMSPEQANRQPTTATTDLYSLGAVLYHMLTGAPPFEAATFAEYVYKHTQESPQPLRQQCAQGRRPTAALEAVVQRCMEKTPTDRFPSAQALRQALTALPSEHQRDRPSTRWLVPTDRTGVVTRLCVAAGTVALLVALFTWSPRRPPAPPAPAVPPPPARVVVQPDARATPPRPTLIELRIESTPPRALVRRLGPRVRILGLTPLVLQRPRQPGSWLLEVRQKGYVPDQLRVSLNTHSTHRVTLQPTVEANPQRPKPTTWRARPRWAPRRVPPRPVDPRGIINPWGEAMRR